MPTDPADILKQALSKLVQRQITDYHAQRDPAWQPPTPWPENPMAAQSAALSLPSVPGGGTGTLYDSSSGRTLMAFSLGISILGGLDVLTAAQGLSSYVLTGGQTVTGNAFILGSSLLGSSDYLVGGGQPFAFNFSKLYAGGRGDVLGK